jgi:hypothetical protein
LQRCNRRAANDGMKAIIMYTSLIIILFNLSTNKSLPGGSTHTLTQNNSAIIQNTGHKTTQKINDTLHTINAMQKCKDITEIGRSLNCLLTISLLL